MLELIVRYINPSWGKWDFCWSLRARHPTWQQIWSCRHWTGILRGLGGWWWLCCCMLLQTMVNTVQAFSWNTIWWFIRHHDASFGSQDRGDSISHHSTSRNKQLSCLEWQYARTIPFKNKSPESGRWRVCHQQLLVLRKHRISHDAMCFFSAICHADLLRCDSLLEFGSELLDGAPPTPWNHCSHNCLLLGRVYF